MALEKTITTASGLVAENAYHRVEGVQLEGKDTISFRLRSYKDSSTLLPSFHEYAFKCAYTLTGTNPIAQAYVFVKTQEAFTDAKDC
jgi:hypothetical protein